MFPNTYLCAFPENGFYGIVSYYCRDADLLLLLLGHRQTRLYAYFCPLVLLALPKGTSIHDVPAEGGGGAGLPKSGHIMGDCVDSLRHVAVDQSEM